MKLGRDYLFGSGKTWRGLVSATIVGMLAAGLQALLYDFSWFNEISLINYQRSWLAFGFCAGAGAILGDLIKSFFKRRVHISSGGSWPVFDQLDFIVGFFVATWWLLQPGWEVLLAAAVLTLILHPLTNIIAYSLKLKKVWW
jgi:CDP-2,3-bis-(O-geranylgeranyl)-sn-glycerol synthase